MSVFLSGDAESSENTIAFTMQEFYLLSVLKRSAIDISQTNLHVAFAKQVFAALFRIEACVVYQHF